MQNITKSPFCFESLRFLTNFVTMLPTQCIDLSNYTSPDIDMDLSNSRVLTTITVAQNAIKWKM